MSTRRPLSEAELENLVQKMFEEEEVEDDANVCESDLSEENVELDDLVSVSEQDISDDEQDVDISDDEQEVDISADKKFYTGKDKTTKWCKDAYNCTGKTKNINIVKAAPGPKHCAKNISNELDAFSKIIDSTMIDEILACTNIYIDYLRSRQEYGRERDCKQTSKSEFMAYLGLLFLIGIKKSHFTNVKEIWANDGTGIEICRVVMSYKRFLFLTRCLRFDNKFTREERRKTDKLAAIRKFLDGFVNNSQACYNLSEYTTIDEMLHPFKGRCQFMQYMPNKEAKYGIKMYALCDAKTFYTFNLEVYCGIQPPGPYVVSNAAMDIVKRLVAPIENSNRNLTTDNYYTSIQLADYLLEKKITLIGALKKNKIEIPPEFLPHRNKVVHSTLFGFQRNKMMSSYIPRKNKAVILLSTIHDKEEINKTTKKPQILMDYNATKGGVDTVDKLCAAYTVARITRRWPCTIFFNLMNIAGVNAYILYSYSRHKESKFRKIFLKNLSLSMMEEHLNFRSKLKNLPSDIAAFLKMKYPQPETEAIDPQEPLPKRGVCRLCAMEKKRTSASMKCSKCNTFTCKRHSVVVCLHCK